MGWRVYGYVCMRHALERGADKIRHACTHTLRQETGSGEGLRADEGERLSDASGECTRAGRVRLRKRGSVQASEPEGWACEWASECLTKQRTGEYERVAASGTRVSEHDWKGQVHVEG